MVSVLTTTNYLYDGPDLLEELDQNGSTLAKYTQGENIDEPFAELRSGTVSYYQSDGLDSVVSMTNSTDALVATYNYDSFGNSSVSTGSLINPFHYTSREFDTETGIYNYRARYYDPQIGRFISEDPIGFVGGYDFYTYVNNNPIDLIDPNGVAGSGNVGNLATGPNCEHSGL